MLIRSYLRHDLDHSPLVRISMTLPEVAGLALLVHVTRLLLGSPAADLIDGMHAKWAALVARQPFVYTATVESVSTWQLPQKHARGEV